MTTAKHNTLWSKIYPANWKEKQFYFLILLTFSAEGAGYMMATSPGLFTAHSCQAEGRTQPRTPGRAGAVPSRIPSAGRGPDSTQGAITRWTPASLYTTHETLRRVSFERKKKKNPTDHKNTNLGDRDGKDRKRSTWGHCPCRYATRLYSHGLGTPSFSTTPSFLKCLSIFWQMLQMRSFPIRRFLALEGSQLLTGDEEHSRRLPDGQPATPPRLPAGFTSAHAGFNTQTRSPSRAGVGWEAEGGGGGEAPPAGSAGA